MSEDGTKDVSKEAVNREPVRTVVAACSFCLMIGGVALLSVPWAMIMGGGLPLAAAIYGQFRQPPKGVK